MTVYVALLRSVNVSGHNRLSMEALRKLVAAAGLDEVRTYVQSGNVVGTGRGPTARVARAIEARMDSELGWSVPVLVRSRSELQQTLVAMPHSVGRSDPKTLHVTFLARAPDPEAVKSLTTEVGRSGADRAVVVGREVFLHCPGGYGQTRFNNAFLERRLGVDATTRNWRTVTTLAGMAGIEA